MLANGHDFMEGNWDEMGWDLQLHGTTSPYHKDMKHTIYSHVDHIDQMISISVIN
jgi:hypothetical protein